MGVVTSLGAGKRENWEKLTAGQSGIRTISRFPTDGLKTRIAGTIDFVPAEPFCAPALSERFAEHGDRGGHRRSRHGRRQLPRPAVPRGAAGRDRMAAAPGARAELGRERQHHLRRHPARLRHRAASRPITSASCSARWPSTWPTSSAPRARRSRCRPPAPPARPRSSSASRRSGAAKPTRRCASAPTARSIRNRSSASRCFRRCRRRTIRRRRRRSPSPRTATAS